VWVVPIPQLISKFHKFLIVMADYEITQKAPLDEFNWENWGV